MSAIENIDSFEIGRPFGPWFHRIVANRAHNVIKSRARRRGESLSSAIPARGISPDEAALKAEAVDRVAVALERLPHDQRMMIRLFELEGFSSTEIGEIMDVAPGTVRWHLHQARSKLRSILDPDARIRGTEAADG